MAVPSSNFNRFSKFFYHWKAKEFPTKLYIIFHHTLSVLPHYLWEFKGSNLAQIWKKMQTKNVT